MVLILFLARDPVKRLERRVISNTQIFYCKY